MLHVKDIIKPAVIVSESDTFEDALNSMIKQQSNTLLVIDHEGTLSGEVTIADLLDAIVPSTLNGNEVMDHFSTDEAFIASIEVAKEIPIAEFMSQDFTPLTLNDDLMSIIATAIAQQRVRIPVIDKDGRPIGIISRQGLKRILGRFMNGEQ